MLISHSYHLGQSYKLLVAPQWLINTLSAGPHVGKLLLLGVAFSIGSAVNTAYFFCFDLAEGTAGGHAKRSDKPLLVHSGSWVQHPSLPLNI